MDEIVMLKKRYLTSSVVEDLKSKMVFVSGPRQVGKTTLSTELVTSFFKESAYYNWDFREDRKKILASEWPSDANLIILDEIHKYSKWKTLIKGNYDKFGQEHKFLITGSARLNVYRKGGDSLQGRYHNYRLHPFTYRELCQIKSTPHEAFAALNCIDCNGQTELEALYQFGGFPEPLIAQDARTLRRWHRERFERLFREDIRDMESIRDLSNMQLLGDMLSKRVGSILSLNALREDLEVSHKAMSHWMNILESFYYQYRIFPFASRHVRSLKKEPKLYLWDWSEVEEEGARFENCVASHLLKFVHFLEDHSGYKTQLCYLRDRDKREVDFIVVVDGKPWFACEAKLRDTTISPHLRYFNERINIPFCYQVNKDGKEDYKDGNIRVLPASKFFSALI